MQLTINGEVREVEGSPSVSQLLDSLGIEPTRCVVERNGDILARERFDEELLTPDDTLEIVRFVGGG